ncbi:MAG: FHA domain-containing protein [Planctomycetaceae bacterium]|jgi:two-component system, NtrC family, sensor kinase|nr:FHA domain-containing protein [Planctomycetaceae bacterium]MBT6485938.1 FHA domain-containing protein [Planctomycetaceae bacterium]MBT6493764.1 FHA domain-containing protein [Planctomycetaceae bacterium]
MFWYYNGIAISRVAIPEPIREKCLVSTASILIIQGVDQGARFQVEAGGSAGIGRGAKNEIRILDTEVSRRHATLEYGDGHLAIVDLGSSNGTFVNGQPVRTRQLADGDQIQIGRSILLLNMAGDVNESEWAGDLVDLVGRQGADDRSSIVSEVSQEVDRELLDHSADAGTQELAQTLANLQVLYRISDEAVSPSISLEQLLQRILDLTIEVVGADRGCMLLDDPETGELVPHVFARRRGFDADAKMPVSRSIVDYVLQEGQGVRTSDARRDRRFEPGQSILQAGIREAMCVPMQGRYELRGVVYVDTTIPPERVVLDGVVPDKFSEEQLRLLVAIARQAALAIENNRYQQALLKAERLATMGQTIAMLSHHIKNILQGVRGGSYLIDMGLKDHNEELVHKGWGIVEKNQNRIYHLVMDMLTFSKERQPALESAQLNETVGEVCELMQSRADDAKADLEFQPMPDLPVTVFDPEGIYRAVLNVVTNAIDATEATDSGTVRVETGYDGNTDSVYVCVTDNGAGIPEDQLKMIFNAFESTKGARGTGLGLAVSRKILREHGGDITVETEVGRGSQFLLTWPSIEEDPQPKQAGTETMTG